MHLTRYVGCKNIGCHVYRVSEYVYLCHVYRVSEYVYIRHPIYVTPYILAPYIGCEKNMVPSIYMSYTVYRV